MVPLRNIKEDYYTHFKDEEAISKKKKKKKKQSQRGKSSRDHPKNPALGIGIELIGF